MSSSSIQDRATESHHLIITDILPRLGGAKQGRSPAHWAFYCPLPHRKKNAAAAIWIDDEGRIGVHCFDCQRNTELWDLLVAPALRGKLTTRWLPAPGRIAAARPEASRFNPAPDIWARCESIPQFQHPSRCWFARRNLWPPDLVCPDVLRWLPGSRTLAGPHTGAGSVVALLAPPKAWEHAWPHVPPVTAVEINAIGRDGSPALDRRAERGGLGKRTLGDKQGTVCVIGNPRLSEAEKPVRVAEGIADALALAARFSGPAIATMGDSGMKSPDLAAWLSSSRAGIVIHADNDQPGQTAATRLRLAVLALGGKARAVLPPHGKDAADTAAALPLMQNSREVWPAFAENLQQMYDWPPWEAQRQASILFNDAEEL